MGVNLPVLGVNLPVLLEEDHDKHEEELGLVEGLASVQVAGDFGPITLETEPQQPQCAYR